ncbi:MAG: xylose isomerase [Spirochaetaceae bacterium]
MKEFFPEVPKIKYEGPDSKNPMAFKFYNPDEKVGDKTMREHLRFSMAYWHDIIGTGADPFGGDVFERPWLSITDPQEQAKARMRGAFEVLDKLGLDFFCFHDTDIAPEGEKLSDFHKNFDEIVELTKQLMADYDKKRLWGTACLFKNKRYMHGAATSPLPEVFAYAASQVKKAIEATHYLGGANYTFWGGREGYDTLLNTEMGLEMDNYARLLEMAVDFKKKLGFDGQFLIEPKPMEPTKHQYDYDVAAILGFLLKYKLIDHFKINIEQNHAILAGHTYAHEIRLARENGILGSLDANEGDYLLGWDTDQLPTNIYESTFVMYEVLKAGGLAPGGLNFDAKLRRHSFKPDDIFLGKIAGMDTYARGLKIAHALLEGGEIEEFVQERYKGWKSGLGKEIMEGKVGFEELEKYTLENGHGIEVPSGRREMLEAIVNRYI